MDTTGQEVRVDPPTQPAAPERSRRHPQAPAPPRRRPASHDPAAPEEGSPSYNPKADTKLLERAYRVAEEAHDGQFRLSGEPYITHPVAVAEILADLRLDTTTLTAALLHDTVEDTSIGLGRHRGAVRQRGGEIVDG